MAAATDSPFRSPRSDFDHPSPSPPRAEAVVAWSANQADPPLPETASREVPDPEAPHGRSVGEILRERRKEAELFDRAAVAARAAAAALCLISFSVMAADRNRGWTLDSFDRYNEYRYCLSVNVIGFVYAAFQALAEVHHKMNKSHIISKPLGFYFDFAMDQILAYLLISASSSATSRTDYWVENWGSDPFPSMISGSVAVSFLAFIAFAVSSFISAHRLFTHRSF